MDFAYFDADGVCTGIGDIPMEPPTGGTKRVVPAGYAPRDLWLDGEVVRQVEDCTIKLPGEIDVTDADVEIALPAGVVAVVDGEVMREKISIAAGEERDVKIVLRGRMAGEAIVRVRSYAERRKDAYPGTGDQLGALWKAIDALSAAANADLGEEARGMLDQIAAVKGEHPKTGAEDVS